MILVNWGLLIQMSDHALLIVPWRTEQTCRNDAIPPAALQPYWHVMGH